MFVMSTGIIFTRNPPSAGLRAVSVQRGVYLVCQAGFHAELVREGIKIEALHENLWVGVALTPSPSGRGLG